MVISPTLAFNRAISSARSSRSRSFRAVAAPASARSRHSLSRAIETFVSRTTSSSGSPRNSRATIAIFCVERKSASRRSCRRPASFVMSDTPVEVQFTSAGCLIIRAAPQGQKDQMQPGQPKDQAQSPSQTQQSPKQEQTPQRQQGQQGQGPQPGQGGQGKTTQQGQTQQGQTGGSGATLTTEQRTKIRETGPRASNVRTQRALHEMDWARRSR